MSIEKDINQGRFGSEYHKASVNLLFTHNWVMEKVKEICASENLTPQQFNILRILRGSFPEPLSTMQIRQRMLDKMSDTSRIVDRLIVKGLVKKNVSLKDKRLVAVQITPQGKQVLEKMDIKQTTLDNILGNLTAAEASILSDLLDKIRHIPNE
ncbi:MarR family winged helix-turn-helix transcriptional regulator [Terrimonas rubra]|uniref:MarR family winged helix-turn-helix transcriptional regulator n=1 Tax=Terrimonas rubra TaxID=1035890 RepID=A0ABW6A1D9_9BACT